MRNLRTSVLINCYNYAPYITDAIKSVLAQTQAVDEIIIVDDGSTDDSLARIQEAVRGVDNAMIVAKKNEGQLSAFNAGFEPATGDILFFLDADDMFEPRHVATVCGVYEQNQAVDTVWTAFRKFGEETDEYHSFDTSVYFGSTVALSCISHKYIGGVTSTVSIRRRAAARFMPVDGSFYADWRTRADDWLSHGAAVAGCRKYYLDEVTVAYRIHGSNNFARKKLSDEEKENYKRIRTRMYEHVRKVAGVREDVEMLLLGEFRQHEKPSYDFFRIYWKAVWKRRKKLKPARVLYYWLGLIKYYWFQVS